MKPCDLYTDASTKQLGSVVTQDNRPIAFFGQKLSGVQSKYTVTELELLAIVETLKEFNKMLWGQRINVYTNHKNLTRDGLGLASDRVACCPEIIYIKGIHNTVVDSISRLDYDPKLNMTNEYNHAMHVKSTKVVSNQKWMMFSTFWSCFSETQDPDELNMIEMNHVFANRSKEDKIFPLTVNEIVEAQKADQILKHLFKSNAVLSKGLELQLVENESCICHVGKLVIPKPLQWHATIWYHHYLQHPDNENCDILERNVYHHPIHNEVMQDLPNK